MFYVPFFHFKVNNWEHKKIKLIEFYNSIQEEFENVEEKNLFTNYYKNDKKALNLCCEVFQEELKKLLSEINAVSYQVNNVWFEKAATYGFHKIHHHGPIGYSSVCFINFDKNEHTPTQFISPFNNFLNGHQLSYNPKNIDEGSIIFFPSAIQHFTEPNYSSKERLILSFNLNLE